MGLSTVKFRKTLKSYLFITLGSILMSVGIYFFKFPNNFSTGGVSALSLILSSLMPKITPGEYMLVTNIILLFAGVLVFGKKFAFKTVYCSMILSLFTLLFEKIIPLTHTVTNEKMIELIFAIGLTAVGSAMIFNEYASSGGTDIIAMILKKYTNLNIGKALFCADFVLAGASIFVFNIETGLFSLLGLLLKAFVVDAVIDGINLNKCFIIVTSKNKEVCDFINTVLKRGATISECKGSFTDANKTMIVTVLKRNQAKLLKQYIKEIDMHAFTLILNSSDVLGKGFRNVL